MHEDDGILEEFWIVRRNNALGEIGLLYQSLLFHHGEELVQRGGGVVCAAGMAKLGDDERTTRDLAAAQICDDLRAVELLLEFAAGGIGQNVAADACDLLDLVFHIFGIVAFAEWLGEFPIAREAARAIHDTGAAAGVETPEPELGVLWQVTRIDFLLG